jgi:Reverse transcriptase (RNA-dependent DNA polymerase)
LRGFWWRHPSSATATTRQLVLDQIDKGYYINRISLIHCIPNNQYGFVRGKSTVKAVRVLVNEINDVVYEKKTPLYAMFLDLRKAFDTIDREVMFKKLVETKKLSMVELKFLAHAMDLNFLHIKDGVTASKIIVQSNAGETARMHISIFLKFCNLSVRYKYFMYAY